MCSDTESDNEGFEVDKLVNNAPNKSALKKKKTIRLKWSDEELRSLKDGFHKQIMNRKIPKYPEVKKFLQSYPILAKRSLAQIKSRIQQIIKMKG